MSFKITTGAEKDAAERQEEACWNAVSQGHLRLVIPLNGGREERRWQREFWSAYAQQKGLAIEASASLITIRRAEASA